MNLRTVRRSKDISQAELAKIADVDQTTISDIERGRNKNPSWKTVASISKALGVNPEELFPANKDTAA